MYLQARFSACTHSNSLSIWAKSAHNLERRFGGNELSRSWSKASCRTASDPILFGERVRRIDSRLALIFMLPACGLFMAGQQVGSGTKQIILSLADNENESGKLPRFGNGFYFSEVNRWPNEAQENNCKNWNLGWHLGCLPLCQTDRSEITQWKSWGKWNDIFWLNWANQ